MALRSTQSFILSTSIKRVSTISGDLVAKSKLSPGSGSVALRQLNPIHNKGLQSSYKQFSHFTETKIYIKVDPKIANTVHTFVI